MDTQLPAPFVQPDVDLRSFPGFILDVNRLLNSEFFAKSSPEEFRAAMVLWCVSWQQSPPASLPDDDKVLASFSRAGSRWLKVKGMALWGFVRCSDGRLYHKVLAQEANSAWERRKKFSERGKEGNKSRWKKPSSSDPYAILNPSLCDPSRIANATAAAILDPSLCDPCSSQLKRSEVKETTYSSAHSTSDSNGPHAETSARPQNENPKTNTATLLAIELRKLGVQIGLSHPALYEWLEKVTPEMVVEAVAVARTRKPTGQIPALYLSPIINDLANGAKHETPRSSGGSTGAAIIASGFSQLREQKSIRRRERGDG